MDRISPFPKSKEVAQLANEAYEKIAVIHSSANTINQLGEKEEKAMKSLLLLQYDRWGQPIIEDASEPIINKG